jgi:hypothetical protein
MAESLRFPLAGKPVGFMVWNPDRSMPTHVHDTFEDALAEAERLKRYAPRERFFVMAPVIDTLTVTYGAGFDAGRKAGLNEAHQQIMDAEARADRAMDRDGDRATQLRLLDPIFQKARDFQAIVADAPPGVYDLTMAEYHGQPCDGPSISPPAACARSGRSRRPTSTRRAASTLRRRSRRSARTSAWAAPPTICCSRAARASTTSSWSGPTSGRTGAPPTAKEWRADQIAAG